PFALVTLLVLAYAIGLINSLLALLLDESFGFNNSARDTRRLITAALLENLGYRQMTVVWRIRAILGGRSTKGWGNMPRRGVSNLGSRTAYAHGTPNSANDGGL
ncbi:MAG TPA: hypothetical protein VIW94_10615, partial [Acidimicrobiia bacterium]